MRPAIPHEEEENDTRNPLWIVAIGMGCVLLVMAAVIALSVGN